MQMNPEMRKQHCRELHTVFGTRPQDGPNMSSPMWTNFRYLEGGEAKYRRCDPRTRHQDLCDARERALGLFDSSLPPFNETTNPYMGNPCTNTTRPDPPDFTYPSTAGQDISKDSDCSSNDERGLLQSGQTYYRYHGELNNVEDNDTFCAGTDTKPDVPQWLRRKNRCHCCHAALNHNCRLHPDPRGGHNDLIRTSGQDWPHGTWSLGTPQTQTDRTIVNAGPTQSNTTFDGVVVTLASAFHDPTINRNVEPPTGIHPSDGDKKVFLSASEFSTSGGRYGVKAEARMAASTERRCHFRLRTVGAQKIAENASHTTTAWRSSDRTPIIQSVYVEEEGQRSNDVRWQAQRTVTDANGRVTTRYAGPGILLAHRQISWHFGRDAWKETLLPDGTNLPRSTNPRTCKHASISRCETQEQFVANNRGTFLSGEIPAAQTCTANGARVQNQACMFGQMAIDIIPVVVREENEPTGRQLYMLRHRFSSKFLAVGGYANNRLGNAQRKGLEFQAITLNDQNRRGPIIYGSSTAAYVENRDVLLKAMWDIQLAPESTTTNTSEPVTIPPTCIPFQQNPIAFADCMAAQAANPTTAAGTSTPGPTTAAAGGGGGGGGGGGNTTTATGTPGPTTAAAGGGRPTATPGPTTAAGGGGSGSASDDGGGLGLGLGLSRFDSTDPMLVALMAVGLVGLGGAIYYQYQKDRKD